MKPANLLLDRRGHVHVADFGVASAVGLDSFTQTGTVIGTAGYLSPEQATGTGATFASDRYALAVVAWELLTGQRPFAAVSSTAEALAHVNAPVPSPHAANRSLPRELDPVFERALAKSPDARYATAAEFVGDLHRALDDAAGATWIQPPLAAAATRIVASGPGRARAWRRWAAALLVLFLLGVGIGIALLAFRDSPAAAPQIRTVVRTVQETVTTAPATTAPAASSSESGAALNDAGYAKLQAGDSSAALPLLEQAVQKLAGTGSLDEAYASYNLAYTLFALGRCTDVPALLDRAQAVEGHRKEIDQLRRQADKHCAGRGRP